MKCFVCNNEINNKDHNHIYRCAKNNNLLIPKKDIKYKQICFQFGFDFSYDYMKNQYINNNWSLPDFKKEHGLSYRASQFLLEYFNIPQRTLKESTLLEKTRNKYKQTCIRKFGVENVSKSDKIKSKKASTFTKNYGVNNIWKDPNYTIWLHQEMIKKYGVKSLPNRFGNKQKWWDNQSEEYKKEVGKRLNKSYLQWYYNLNDDQKTELIQKRANCFASKIENRVASILDILNFSYYRQFFIKRKSYDFKISKTNLIIEVNGDYWHCNPNKYSKNDIVVFPLIGEVNVCDIWEKDKYKKELAESKGYKMIYIWECDITSRNDNELSSYISDLIGEYYYESCKS